MTHPAAPTNVNTAPITEKSAANAQYRRDRDSGECMRHLMVDRAYASCAPGRPVSTTNDLRVISGAPGLET
jgi:hypothetical protein